MSNPNPIEKEYGNSAHSLNVENYGKPVYIANLSPVDAGPKYPQSELLQRLANTYARELQNKGRNESPEHWKNLLERFGCGPEAIGFRSGVELDILSAELCNSDLSQKMKIYDEHCGRYLKSLFAKTEMKNQPEDIIHVSCTGYIAPSPVQQALSRAEQFRSRVTHFYHMGCYAAMPATRWSALRGQSQTGRTQIIHTELCSLHFRPSSEIQDWVVQSLFADGFISYEITDQAPPRGLKILRSAEALLPTSLDLMSWNLSAMAFQMTLSRDVPKIIAGRVQNFVEQLMHGVDLRQAKIYFAVHPGGPKIIQQVQAELKLEPWQTAASRDILYRYGNMSSATVPHIWHKLVSESEVLAGSFVVSLAFGPGLSISGQLAQVVGPTA